MSLYQRPLEAILAAIKSQNGVTLVEGEYTYGAPAVVADDGSGTNTSIQITAKDLQSTYDGTVAVRYKRLSLADLSTLVPTTIKAYGLTTMDGVAQRLNALYGTDFTTDDIVQGSISLTNGAGVVTLVAKSTSLGWIGQVDITIQLGAMPLGDFLTVTRLPGLNYPTGSTTKPFAQIYSYWRDFSVAHDVLDTVALGTDGLAILTQTLKTVTNDTWVETGSSRYTLDGAVVSYVGAASDYPTANPDYNKVIVVDLLEAKSLGLSGSLYLHYNTGA